VSEARASTHLRRSGCSSWRGQGGLVCSASPPAVRLSNSRRHTIGTTGFIMSSTMCAAWQHCWLAVHWSTVYF